MFIIYINDLPIASDLFNFITYADDTNLTITLDVFNRPGDLNNNVNEELNKICDWLNVNKLALNVDKTKAMIFHMPQKKVEKPVLLVNGTVIEYVNNFNFLGITLNNHLNWDSHINKVARKISRTTGILNKQNFFFTTAYSKDNVQFYHITSYKLWYIGLGVSNATHIYTSEKKQLE